jgi:hypothetical protein
VIFAFVIIETRDRDACKPRDEASGFDERFKWCIIHKTMRSKLLTLSLCVLLAACAPDIKETGISRERAITIAKQACPEYPDRFNFVDKAEWVPEKGFWAVLLDNQSATNGRVYKINRNGVIVGTRDITHDRPLGYYDGPYNGGPYYGGGYYGGGPYYGPQPVVVVGGYGGGYHRRWWY